MHVEKKNWIIDKWGFIKLYGYLRNFLNSVAQDIEV